MAELPSRKLAVIMHVDVVGSTGLVRQNESLAHQRIRGAFGRLASTIESYGGIPHEVRGDALVAEFARASDAVCAAIAFQDENTTFNTSLGDDLKPGLRVGIAMGEVVIADNTITGDGVVMAQRLEQIADSGGVCIQGAAYEIVPKRLPFAYRSLGEQVLKGFSEPVRAYSVSLTAGEVVPPPESTEIVTPVLELPDKPSIAVLPFTNMSGDPEQEYLSDGITEDIITELSRFRELFVIARNSSFSYKDKAVKVQVVASELGIRYVVEGSVRASDNRIRITAQLIDAETGYNAWSERYDRDLKDIFTVQDEITQTVAGTVAGQINIATEARALRKPIEHLDAYDYVLRAQSIIAVTKEDNLRAREAYTKAVELDPGCARAYQGLALSYVIDWFNRWGTSAQVLLDKGLEHAAKAVSLDNTDSRSQMRLGHLLMHRGEVTEARTHLARALELNPNDADGIAFMGILLGQTGQHEEAIKHYLTAMRLNPYYPAWYLWMLGSAYYEARKYVDALHPLREAINRNPKFMKPRTSLAATYAQLGRVEDARRVVQEVLTAQPGWSLKLERDWWGYDENLDHWVEGLRKAGLPE